MTINPDLHPDDTAHRRDVVAQLRRIRVSAGLRQEDLAPILYANSDFVSALERRRHPNPPIVTVQRHARALGHIATLVLHGIDTPTTADMRTYAAVAATATDPEVADLAVRWLCIARLTACRRQLGWSRSTAAVRMGVTDDTLYGLETGQEALLATCQRYARALGGWLTVELRPVEALERVEARAA